MPSPSINYTHTISRPKVVLDKVRNLLRFQQTPNRPRDFLQLSSADQRCVPGRRAILSDRREHVLASRGSNTDFWILGLHLHRHSPSAKFVRLVYLIGIKI